MASSLGDTDIGGGGSCCLALGSLTLEMRIPPRPNALMLTGGGLVAMPLLAMPAPLFPVIVEDQSGLVTQTRRKTAKSIRITALQPLTPSNCRLLQDWRD